MTTIKFNPYGWNTYIVPVPNGLVTKPFLKSNVNGLFTLFELGNFYNVLLTVEYANNQYRNLGKTNKVCIDDKSKLLDALFGYYDHKTDSYR